MAEIPLKNNGFCATTEEVSSPSAEESSAEENPLFDNLVWLNTKDAAIYLRKFKEDGSPSVEAIRKLVYRGAIRPRIFRRRLFFKRLELDFLLEGSQKKRGLKWQ